jgi:hypothetical protein
MTGCRYFLALRQQNFAGAGVLLAHLKIKMRQQKLTLMFFSPPPLSLFPPFSLHTPHSPLSPQSPPSSRFSAPLIILVGCCVII